MRWVEDEEGVLINLDFVISLAVDGKRVVANVMETDEDGDELFYVLFRGSEIKDALNFFNELKKTLA